MSPILVVEYDEEHRDWVVYQPNTDFIQGFETKNEAFEQAKDWADSDRTLTEVEVYNQDGSFDGVWSKLRQQDRSGSPAGQPPIGGEVAGAVQDDLQMAQQGLGDVGRTDMERDTSPVEDFVEGSSFEDLGSDNSEVVGKGKDFIESVGTKAYDFYTKKMEEREQTSDSQQRSEQ